MPTQLELIKIFCSTYDIKDFLKLNIKTQEFFKAAAEYLLALSPVDTVYGGLYKGKGIAQIVSNTMTHQIYKPFKKIYSVLDMELIESTKYDMKLLFIGDSHTYQHGCPKISDPISFFIQEQIRTATCFIDLFLEVPYIFEKRAEPIRVGNTFMAITHADYWDCFTWDKHFCPYGNLRAHYIDLRNIPNDPYFSVEKIIVSLFYGHSPKDNNELLNNPKVKKIFQNADSCINYIDSLIKTTKINKQLNNITQPEVKKVLLKYQQLWKEPPSHATPSVVSWNNIQLALKDKASKRLINDLYFTLASLPATLMDVYTVARMFRTYKNDPQKYSLPAKNIILFAGNFHNNRYRDLLVNDLGFKITQRFAAKSHNWQPGKGQKKAGNLCVDVSNLDQPVFRSPLAAQTQKPSTKKHKKTKMPAPPPTPPNEDMTQEDFDNITEVLSDNVLFSESDLEDIANMDDLSDFDPTELNNFDPDVFDDPPPETPNLPEE